MSTICLFTATGYTELLNSYSIFANYYKINLVIVKECPPPPPKPQTIVYEKYLPPPSQCQTIVRCETCQPSACTIPIKPVPRRRLIREIVRQVPQQCAPVQPAVVCKPRPQQKITPAQSQIVQRMVPVFATRQVS